MKNSIFRTQKKKENSKISRKFGFFRGEKRKPKFRGFCVVFFAKFRGKNGFVLLTYPGDKVFSRKLTAPRVFSRTYRGSHSTRARLLTGPNTRRNTRGLQPLHQKASIYSVFLAPEHGFQKRGKKNNIFWKFFTVNWCRRSPFFYTLKNLLKFLFWTTTATPLRKVYPKKVSRTIYSLI